MICDLEQVDAYFDGELFGEEKRSVEEHLQVCIPCREELERTRNLDLLYRKGAPGVVPQEESYVQEVRQKVGARKGMSWMGMVALFLMGLTIWNVYEALFPPGKPLGESHSLRSELIRYSSTESALIRDQIFSRIARKEDSNLPLLVVALEDRDVRIQIAATQILSRFRDDRVRVLLLETVRAGSPVGKEPAEEWNLEEPAVSPGLYHAMDVAERSSDPGGLFDMISDQWQDPEIRDALGEWVEDLLSSGKSSRQYLAIQILRQGDLPLTWWRLIPLLDSSEVGASVLDLFRARSGKEFGPDPELWRRYFQEL